MQIMIPTDNQCSRRMLLVFALGCCGMTAPAEVPDPSGGSNAPPAILEGWSFTDTNGWTCDLGHAPLSFTNVDYSWLGNWTALAVDRTNAARLQFRLTESDGTNHLRLDHGAVKFWFAPFWSGTNVGGTGPGEWARLLEVGSYTTNASCGWWSLFVDPAGANLYFGAQTNGAEAMYIAMPIAWTTNRWHLVALNYTATNTQLYLDGALATNGPGVSYWPGGDALTNGFFIGSDGTGTAQMRGMLDDLATYAAPLDAGAIAAEFDYRGFVYFVNPMNFANLMNSATSAPSFGPEFNAITGIGNLSDLGAAANCSFGSTVRLTNVSAFVAANGKATVDFDIAGGVDGLHYDVFASSILLAATSTNGWAWMGQGSPCRRYRLPNLPLAAAFLILGTPQNRDGDGLTDAYELLVSKTDPTDPDSDGDGMSDGWEVAYGLKPKSTDASGDLDGDGLSNLEEYIHGTDPQVKEVFQLVYTEPKSTSLIP